MMSWGSLDGIEMDLYWMRKRVPDKAMAWRAPCCWKDPVDDGTH